MKLSWYILWDVQIEFCLSTLISKWQNHAWSCSVWSQDSIFGKQEMSWLKNSGPVTLVSSHFHITFFVVLSMNLQWKFWGGKAMFVCPHFQPPCRRKAGAKNDKAVMHLPVYMLMSLTVQTSSISLLNMGHGLIYLNHCRRNVSSRRHDTEKSFSFPLQCLFQFILKINHLLSQLNVRGLLFCSKSELFRRPIKASFCSGWIVKRQNCSFYRLFPALSHSHRIPIEFKENCTH